MKNLAIEIERIVSRLIKAREIMDVEHLSNLEALGRDRDGKAIISAMRITK